MKNRIEQVQNRILLVAAEITGVSLAEDKKAWKAGRVVARFQKKRLIMQHAWMWLLCVREVWGSSPRKFWKTYSKTIYSEAFGPKKGGWRGRWGGGGQNILSSDLHWSQEWSRLVPKSPKAWKAWKSLTPEINKKDQINSFYIQVK